MARLEQPELLEQAAALHGGPIYVFGLTSVSPAYLHIFRRLAEPLDVHLFFPNPSLHWWSDIVPERVRLKLDQRLRALREQHGLSDPDPRHLETGHPLLASMGKTGADFLAALYEDTLTQDEDCFVDPAEGSQSLLARLQRDVLLLNEPETEAEQSCDGSICVHSCHSPLREVQVLHDQILAMLDEDETLSPRDIVVMAPDIGAYAPYIEAGFNRDRDDPRHVPYTISDRAAREQHPLVAAFWDLLNLPNSRWSATEILDLLRTPAIARKLELSEADLDLVQTWVTQSGIRWGVDEDFRDSLAAGRFRENSWAFGLDRLLLGYAVGDERALVEGVLPYPHVEGSNAEALGKLAVFVERLRAFDRELRGERSPADWEALLLELADTLFQPAADNPAEAAALNAVRAAVQGFAADAKQAKYDDPLPWLVVREQLSERLDQAGPSQPFLDRGLTFCAMIPMRNIPFRVVCLIGMNSGDFPRQDRRAGFDLMQAKPERGDRSRRGEDRYLFLEALLASRDRFYISYVGRDLRDNTEREPSVLVSELLDLLERCYGQRRDHVLIEHRMHPFSPQYFSGDIEARLFSYAQEWAQAHSKRNAQAENPLFLGAPLTPAEADWREVSLQALTSFFANPARFLLARRLRLRLQELETLPDEEPQQVVGLERYQLCRELVTDALSGVELPSRADARLRARGILPPGAAGELEYHESILPRSVALHEALSPLLDGLPRLEPVEVGPFEFTCGDHEPLRLSGWLTEVYASGLVHWRPGSLRGGDWLKLWIEHLCLQLAAPRDMPSRLIGLAGGRGRPKPKLVSLKPLPKEEARRHLGELLNIYWNALHGQRESLFLFPDCARAYVETLLDETDEAKARQEAEKAWKSSYDSGAANAHVALLTRGIDNPLDEAFYSLARRVFEPLLQAQGE